MRLVMLFACADQAFFIFSRCDLIQLWAKQSAHNGRAGHHGFLKILSSALRSFRSALGSGGFDAPMALGCRGRFKRTLLTHQI